MEPTELMEPMMPMESSPKWWPDDLGVPGTSGLQNDVRCAFFSRPKRLAIQQDGKVARHDSGDDQTNGVSQQQGGDPSLSFTSQNSDVKDDELKKV
jgi:hypothetical protein